MGQLRSKDGRARPRAKKRRYVPPGTPLARDIIKTVSWMADEDEELILDFDQAKLLRSFCRWALRRVDE